MNKFIRYFKEHRNKILAVAFSALALAVFIGYYLVLEVESGWTYFRVLVGTSNDWILEFWNIFFYLVLVFGGLLVRNINNDGNAYHNILIFLFSLAFEAFYFLVVDGFKLVVLATQVNAIGIAMVILFFAFIIAQLVFGSLLYVNFAKYMRGVGVEWSKIRRLAIIMAIIASFGPFLLVVLGLLAGEGIVFIFSIPVAEAFCAWAIVFTLERLRRY